MSDMNLISCEMDRETLVKRSEIRDFLNGTPLVVYESQEAIFFKEGRALDSFGAGRYLLETDNLPETKKFFSRQLNNADTPFSCDVYFVNLVSVLDLLWGTPTPITLTDPKYHIPINVKASGQTGLRIKNARQFVIKVVGQLEEFSVESIRRAIKVTMMSSLTSLIANTIVNEKVGILEIATKLDDLSTLVRNRLNEKLDDLGLELVHFNIGTIFAEEEDLAKIRKLEEERMFAMSATDIERYAQDTLGYTYQQKRQFNIEEKAAETTGIRVEIGATNQIHTRPQGYAPQPQPQATAAGSCPHCSASLPAGAKFCAVCGQKIPEAPAKKFCTNCGTQADGAARFCANCGHPF